MVEYYLEIKAVHVYSVLASGGLLLLRGLAAQLGARWATAAPLRCQYPFVHEWLTAKVVLLVVYIVLGSFALGRGRTRGIRTACCIAAVVVFAAIYRIARTHDPLGPLRFLPFV
jgi:uncharacterized membrane protein SirB2